MDEVLSVGIDWCDWCWEFNQFKELSRTGGWTERDWRSLPLRERCHEVTERGARMVLKFVSDKVLLKMPDQN